MATAGKPEIPNPNEKLVKVFDSDVESEVMVVRGILESAGIAVDEYSLDATKGVFPGVGGVTLLVREEDADGARALIEDYRTNAAADEGELEEETEGESTS
jgi:hypothetical protein